LEYEIIKACERVSIQACEHPSMWAINKMCTKSEHRRIWSSMYSSDKLSM